VDSFLSFCVPSVSLCGMVLVFVSCVVAMATCVVIFELILLMALGGVFVFFGFVSPHVC
jgi:hypothetical protein